LSWKQISGLVKKVKSDAPLKQVAFSGGEPMLRNDLPDIVSDLADDGLSSVIITNGTLLSASRIKRFPSDTIFEITLFSANAKVHNYMAGSSVFDRILEGLVCLERNGGRFVLVVVITKLNAHDVRRTIELAIALGADTVMLNRVNLSRHTLPIADELVPSVSMLRECLDAAEDAAADFGISIALSVPVPPCLVDPRRYSNLHFGWCPRGNKESYYTIGWDGLLRPCNHSSVTLGDLRKQSFKEIILGSRTDEFWKPVPYECQRCEHPLKHLCRGGCPAAADECFGSRDYIDPMVVYARALAEIT
jgi:pyrroloquinoline quinone biosynthesis protein E